MSSSIHARERCRSRISAAAVLVIMLAASACSGGAKECRQWRLQAEVPMGTKVTTATRATSDRATLEQAQWATLSAPNQPPAAPQPWADRFPEVGYSIASPDGVVSSAQPQTLTVIVSDGCD